MELRDARAPLNDGDTLTWSDGTVWRRVRGSAGVAEAWDSWYALTRQHAMTVADIQALAPGESVDVVVFDRNWCDILLDSHNCPRNLPGMAHAPNEFCRNIKARFTKGDHPEHFLRGRLTLYAETEALDVNDGGPFELEVLVADEDMWWPTVNGMSGCNGDKAVADMPPNETKVGWRGHMIPADALNNLPPVGHGFA